MDERGQTIIDYSFGVGIFLIVVLFVFITIPSLFAPFESQQEDLQTVERVETALTTNWLLTPEDPQPYVLDQDCTAYLFANSNTDGSVDAPLSTECRYGGVNEFVNMEDVVPVETSAPGDVQRLNVTMEQRNSTGAYTGEPAAISETETVYDDGDGDGDIDLQYGPSPPDSNAITVSYRQVYMGGEQYRLYVRVW